MAHDCPLPACHCPLCGGPNGCAPALSGTFDSPCWCTTVEMPAKVLARLPAAQRGQACICRACAEAGAGQALTQADSATGG
ncbi:cysteine-rich CWC family protein [Sphaerotilus sp.]|uniref:cysteine-rich CWC family protein n=1 Tax=Sphaerotilus sp. TaxID=2093942 RepID=UPI002ACD4BC7|nr:cysteine-rich CWC family protein [Sphaerotilus sp.]MDZ7858232.1 cysteine-rich CWC family protein [Sphaerotilus sp.]